MRAYGVRARTAARIDAAIDRHYRASVDAQKVTAAVFVTGEFVAALANAAVIVVGVLLGLAGEISAGTLVAFLFLVTLFVAPVQTASEVLNEAQNAVAGFRRVLDVIDTEPDIRDPAIDDPENVHQLPAGPLGVRFDHVSFRYAPGARPALDGIDLTIAPRLRVAIVGETGSGKTTFAKLVTRLMDPVEGRVLLGSDAAGWVPLDEVAFALAARPGGHGAAGRVPLRRDRRRQRPVRAAGHDRRPDRRRLRGAGPRHAGSRGSRTASGRRSASAGSRCRRGSGSWSPSPAPTSPTPTCWCSTRRPAPSTRPPSSG